MGSEDEEEEVSGCRMTLTNKDDILIRKRKQ